MFKCSHGTLLNSPCALCDKEYEDEEYNKQNNVPVRPVPCDPSTWRKVNTLNLISKNSQLFALEES